MYDFTKGEKEKSKLVGNVESFEFMIELLQLILLTYRFLVDVIFVN